MTGFPAARQFDMTAMGGPIVQGSLGVMIGAPTGVACSVCPGGVKVGSPVNPSLGAKVLPDETDIALWVDPLPESHEMALHLFHCDHLGTPIGLINHKTGKVEWSADLDVWGNVQSCDNPHKLRQPIRMQGQHFDEESGLHYNRHRYYDPAQGRYITQDPIGLRGGWNGYQYTDNPVKQVDPLGLSWSSMGSMTNQAGMKDAANAAQQQIFEPWYINAGSYAILNETYNDMKRL
jgi:RHS repeat-associated protein